MFTFEVSEVAPSKKTFRTAAPRTFFEAATGKRVEACSTYHGPIIRSEGGHPLFTAALGAFSEHYPLVLTPDAVWIAIEQGIATHVRENAEALRKRLVTHEGKLEIEVRRDDFVRGSPENPWPEVFSEF